MNLLVLIVISTLLVVNIAVFSGLAMDFKHGIDYFRHLTEEEMKKRSFNYMIMVGLNLLFLLAVIVYAVVRLVI